MFGIRHNIIFSVMAHSILLTAALLIGGSSEIRKASLMTVLLFDEKESNPPVKQSSIPVVEQPARTVAAPKTEVIPKTEVKQKAEVKTVTKLSSIQEILPKQTLAPLTPVAPQSDTGKDSVSEEAGIVAPDTSSQGVGSGISSDSSKTFGSSSGDAAAASALRGQTGRTAEAGADASLKQKIRDALQENLIYPYLARKRGIEGTVIMTFRINGRGMPEGVKIVKGSSYAILDEAARETVLKVSPFPVINTIVEVPIRFSLERD